MMAGDPQRGQFYARISLVMGVCTLVLTFSFIGILALLAGEVDAPGSRIPWYLVLSALAFVATIVLLEAAGTPGREIIVTATVVAVWAFLILALSVEGIIFTISNPQDVFVSQLVVYFLAAALLATGIAYWALLHWREFTGRAPARL